MRSFFEALLREVGEMELIVCGLLHECVSV
jgi:hypothetical protein